MKRIGELAAASYPVTDRAFDLALRMQADQVYALLANELAPLQKQWMDALSELIRFEEEQSEQATADARAAYESARLMMLAIGGLSVVLAMVVSVVISCSIVRQLGGELTYAMSIADRIASGDLAVDVRTATGDHVSLLAATRRMRDNLARMIGQVRSNAETIARPATERGKDVKLIVL